MDRATQKVVAPPFLVHNFASNAATHTALSKKGRVVSKGGDDDDRTTGDDDD